MCVVTCYVVCLFGNHKSTLTWQGSYWDGHHTQAFMTATQPWDISLLQQYTIVSLTVPGYPRTKTSPSHPLWCLFMHSILKCYVNLVYMVTYSTRQKKLPTSFTLNSILLETECQHHKTEVTIYLFRSPFPFGHSDQCASFGCTACKHPLPIYQTLPLHIYNVQYCSMATYMSHMCSMHVTCVHLHAGYGNI